MVSFGKLLLKIIPRSLLIDISFHNFHNAITLCYMSTRSLNLRRVNRHFLSTFKLDSAQLKDISVLELFKIVGLSDTFIEHFEHELTTHGFVREPELKIVIDGVERYFSLFSTYTRDIHLPFLSGVQGQLVERTQEVLLRKKAEKLAHELEEKQVLVDKQNKHLEELSSKLAKYLSPQVYGSIFSGKKEVSISFERKKLTVFFSDIKNFAETTDNMESEDLANLLNHYLDSMSKIALNYGGTIDKYIGDAILIFFGDPETRGEVEDAVNCVRMAMEMRSLMESLRNQWYEKGISSPLHIRIGINTGYCTVGNFGSEERLDYTIIGGQVNLASRLEHKAFADTILISHETYGLIKDEIFCEPKGDVHVKGITHPVKTYEVIDLYENVGKTKKLIEESIPGFALSMNFESLEKHEEVRLILRDALKLLEKR